MKVTITTDKLIKGLGRPGHGTVQDVPTYLARKLIAQNLAEKYQPKKSGDSVPEEDKGV